MSLSKSPLQKALAALIKFFAGQVQFVIPTDAVAAREEHTSLRRTKSAEAVRIPFRSADAPGKGKQSRPVFALSIEKNHAIIIL